METVSPLAPLLLLSVYLKFEFYLRNISWNADIEKKKKKTLSTRQRLRRSHVASSHLKGGKSALRKHEHGEIAPAFPGNATTPTFPRPGPEYPGCDLWPPPGGRGEPQGARGWDRGACERGNNKSPQWKGFCWTTGLNRLASSARTPRSPRRSKPRTECPSRGPAGVVRPAFPTLHNLPSRGTHAAAKIPFSSLPPERDVRGKMMRMYICRAYSSRISL